MNDDRFDKINEDENLSNEQHYNNIEENIQESTQESTQAENTSDHAVKEEGNGQGDNLSENTVEQSENVYTSDDENSTVEEPVEIAEKESANVNFTVPPAGPPPANNTNPVNGNEPQRIWQMQNFQTGGTNPGAPGTAFNNYYRESYKKTGKKSDAWKYVLVSIASSVLGGAILTVMLLVVAPAIQPELKSFIGDIFPNANIDSAQPTVGELKRVEIVQNSESAVTSVAEKVGPSVVGIRTTYRNTNDLFGSQSEGGEGSGIIISSDGYILTNHHVIENAVNDKTRSVQSGAKIEVFLPNKIDKPYTATVKGYDSKTDLAVLKIDEKNLPAIEYGDSDSLKIGEPAIAIGNPGGLEYMGSVTQGVVSGLNRTVQLDNGKTIKLIQTDAAINPGNSGGALVNLKGQLIGVNSIKMVATGFEGLGFAIPVNDAKTIADELIKNTYIAKPYLGVSLDPRYTEDFAKSNNMPMGVYVADVELLGAAEKAGIQTGDVITKFNGKSIKSYAELEDEKNKFKPGDTVDVEIFRDGKTKIIKVKLGETK